MVEFNSKKLLYLAGLITEDARLEIVEGESYPRAEVEDENPALLGGETPYDPHHTSLEDEMNMDMEQKVLEPALSNETVAESKIRKAIRREISTILKEMTPTRSGAIGRTSAGGGHGGGSPTKTQYRGAHGDLADVSEFHGLEEEEPCVPSLVQALGLGTNASTSGRPGHSPGGGKVASYRPGHARRGQPMKGPGFR